jgi:hypothetical protein
MIQGIKTPRAFRTHGYISKRLFSSVFYIMRSPISGKEKQDSAAITVPRLRLKTTDKVQSNYSLNIKITAATLFQSRKTLIYQAFQRFAYLLPLFASARAEFYNRVFSMILTDTIVTTICIFRELSWETDFLQSKCDHKLSILLPMLLNKTLERYAVVKVQNWFIAYVTQVDYIINQ